MNMEKKQLVKKLQEQLVAFLVDRGFQRFPLSSRDRRSREMVLLLPLGYLKRARGSNLDLIEIQIHPRRAAFVLAFGVVLPEGVTLPSMHIAQSEAGVADLPENCRLYANRFFMQWFSPSWLPFPADPGLRIDKPILQVIELYHEVEDYFLRGMVGPHIKCISYSRDPSGSLKATIRKS
jgi:hypothetical protein